MFSTQVLFAQDSVVVNENKKVILRGTVKEKRGLGFENVYVYNTRTNSGLLAEPDGTFILNVMKHDTVKVVSPGYKAQIITLKDSVQKPVYFVKTTMERLVIRLDGIMIESDRSLSEIQKDINQLGSSKYNYSTEKVGQAISSPVSALYERFSKEAKQRKELARLENDALNRKVVKDLLNYYNQEGIINLAQKEYDFFISFCDLSDEFLSYASQYDIAAKIKTCYKNFEDRYQKY
jgi:hypothetical protein